MQPTINQNRLTPRHNILKYIRNMNEIPPSVPTNGLQIVERHVIAECGLTRLRLSDGINTLGTSNSIVDKSHWNADRRALSIAVRLTRCLPLVNLTKGPLKSIAFSRKFYYFSSHFTLLLYNWVGLLSLGRS